MRVQFVVDEIEQFEVEFHQYKANNRIAISLRSLTGEPWGTLTVNIPECKLASDEVIIDANPDRQYWVEPVLEQMKDYLEFTGHTVGSGFLTYRIFKFKGIRYSINNSLGSEDDVIYSISPDKALMDYANKRDLTLSFVKSLNYQAIPEPE